MVLGVEKEGSSIRSDTDFMGMEAQVLTTTRGDRAAVFDDLGGLTP